MTKEEILAMRPGSELNMKVAEIIMGHTIINDEIFGYMERVINLNSTECGSTCCGSKEGDSVWSAVKPYSEDISAAEQVVEKMTELGYKDAVYWADFGNGKYTEPEAICKAALLSRLEGSILKEASDRILRQALGDEEK
ncbi:MAG: hypothetical protein PHU23_12720 [Dehalococcoidales bacterium]|nr:hypothetical protein [Dehalococcoidales bacterium]